MASVVVALGLNDVQRIGACGRNSSCYCKSVNKAEIVVLQHWKLESLVSVKSRQEDFVSLHVTRCVWLMCLNRA